MARGASSACFRGRSRGLQPLPGTTVPSGGFTPDQQTGGDAAGRRRSRATRARTAPPQRRCPSARSTCPAASTARRPRSSRAPRPRTSRAARSSPSRSSPTSAAGDCVTVTFNNERAPEARAPRSTSASCRGRRTRPASTSASTTSRRSRRAASAGLPLLRRHAQDRQRAGRRPRQRRAARPDGLYGAIVVAPSGRDVHGPEHRCAGRSTARRSTSTSPARRATATSARSWPTTTRSSAANFMPYPIAVRRPALVNYRSEPRADDATSLSSNVHGDPTTPLFAAYGGDPTKVHFLVASGSEQTHVFSLGGQYWLFDPEIAQLAARPEPGHRPRARRSTPSSRAARAASCASVGDFFYGDMRRAVHAGRDVGPHAGPVAAELHRRPDQAARRAELQRRSRRSSSTRRRCLARASRSQVCSSRAAVSRGR